MEENQNIYSYESKSLDSIPILDMVRSSIACSGIETTENQDEIIEYIINQLKIAVDSFEYVNSVSAYCEKEKRLLKIVINFDLTVWRGKSLPQYDALSLCDEIYFENTGKDTVDSGLIIKDVWNLAKFIEKSQKG